MYIDVTRGDERTFWIKNCLGLLDVARLFSGTPRQSSFRSRGLAREPVRAAPRCTPRWTSATGSAARAPSTARAPTRARPWRHPHALWLAVIVAVVVLLQGATYARIHARSSRIQSADEEIARRAEAIRAMLVKQEDLREQVAQLREVVVRMDTAVVDTLERGAAARKSNAEPTAATTRPTVASTDPSSSSVASLRERQRILMDRAALANRLAGVAPTDADEAFFETNDAALREMREERAAYARREAAEASVGKMVWSKSVNDAMAGVPTGGAGAGARGSAKKASGSTWDDEDRVVRSARGRSKDSSDDADEDGAFGPAPKSLFASYLGRYGAGGSFLTPSASKAGQLNSEATNGVGVLTDSALGKMGASRLRGASSADNPKAYAAVVIMACDRADYLERTVASVRAALGVRPGDVDKFPVFISQDGRHKATRAFAEGPGEGFSLDAAPGGPSADDADEVSVGLRRVLPHRRALQVGDEDAVRRSRVRAGHRVGGRHGAVAGFFRVL